MYHDTCTCMYSLLYLFIYITWTLYHQQVIETYNLLLWMIDLKNLPEDYEPPSMYNMLVQTRFSYSFVTGSSLIKRLYTFMCTHIQDKYMFSLKRNKGHLHVHVYFACSRKLKKKNCNSKIYSTKQTKKSFLYFGSYLSD